MNCTPVPHLSNLGAALWMAGAAAFLEQNHPSARKRDELLLAAKSWWPKGRAGELIADSCIQKAQRHDMRFREDLTRMILPFVRMLPFGGFGGLRLSK